MAHPKAVRFGDRQQVLRPAPGHQKAFVKEPSFRTLREMEHTVKQLQPGALDTTAWDGLESPLLETTHLLWRAAVLEEVI